MNDHDLTAPSASDVDSLGTTMAATLAGEQAAARTESDRELTDAVPGRALGRYVVLDRLGAGAMGVVLAAYDPELDRKVAIKLLHPREGSSKSNERQLRLVAEAQALARLSDPNVVAVHDVGTHEGRVFVAMEFVEGQTLGRWLAAAGRPWHEVLDVMVRAGRGLAAAHARELIHRDFKPDNVMIDQAGRVRVMDFGLARADSDGTHSSAELETSQPRQRALELQLTNDGMLVGTPAYMAPECIAGARADAAADQFAFCITLWEGLHGLHPFPAETLPSLYARILEGTIAEPPSGSSVPRWLRRVVERGLAVKPERRWPSMQALLDALERGRARARRQRWLGAIATLAAIGVGVLGVSHYQRLRRQQACEREGASIEPVWNDDVAGATREALEQANVAHAATTMDRARPWLDAYVRDWGAARSEACVHAEVDQTWDAPLYARAQWCLDERRMELDALLIELRRGDARTMTGVVSAAAGLDLPSTCTNAEALARMPVGPSDRQDELRTVRAELWRISALDVVGDREEALAFSRRVLEHAEALEWPPIVALARLRMGVLLMNNTQYPEAAEAMERAYFEAAEAEALEVAFVAASRMVGLLGYRLARHEEGLRWARHAELMLSRIPGTNDLRRTPLLVNLSTVHYAMGAYPQAQALAEQVLEIYERMLDPQNPRLSDGLTNLGLFHQAQGHYHEAKELLEQALEIREHALGSFHPEVAKLAGNLASVELQLDHPDQAKALLERVLSIYSEALGPNDLEVARILNNLASVHHSLAEYSLALPLYERAIHIYEPTLGPDHPMTSGTRNNLADTLRLLGDLDRAKEQSELALRSLESGLGPDHPDLAFPLQSLSSIARAQGRFDDAVARAQRAVKVRETAGTGSDMIAEARFVLAKAQWEQGLDRGEALAQARRAAAEYREHGRAHADELAQIAAWLVEHPQ